MIVRVIISREDAFAQGLRRFYSGEPCKGGHVTERYVSNGACLDCQNWNAKRKPRSGPRGRNVGWPTQGLVFNVPDLMPEEVEAAFRYIEAMRWHDYAVLEMRKDPSLLERFAIPLSVTQQAQLHAALEKDRRVRDAILQENEKTVT